MHASDSRARCIGEIIARDLRLVASRLYRMAVTRPGSRADVTIFQMDITFQLETEEKKTMAILKEALGNATGLKTLDNSVGAGQFVMGVNTGIEGWVANLQPEDKKMTGTHVTVRADSGIKPKTDMTQENVSPVD